jgi:hypothetical protein
VLVDELLQPLGSERRFEVVKLEIGEVAGELVQAGLVRLVRVRQEPTPVLAQVRASVLSEREGAIRLVLHRVAPQPGHLGGGE